MHNYGGDQGATNFRGWWSIKSITSRGSKVTPKWLWKRLWNITWERWRVPWNQDQLPHHHLSFKELIKSRMKKKRRFTPMNHPSMKGIWTWVKCISMRPLAYSMILKHWHQILVVKFPHWRSPPSLNTWRRFKEQCATLKVISCLFFYRKNLVELNEWLNEAYLNNNENIRKLKTQNEQLLKRV